MADLGAVRKGKDDAGGILIEGSSDVFVNKASSVRIGDAVQGHGDTPHSSPVMVEGSPNVFVNGIPMCREEDIASCGHPASGSPNVFVNTFEFTEVITTDDKNIVDDNGSSIVRETRTPRPGA